MATVSALHQRDSATWAHLLVIEGFDYAFTDCLDIVGSSWWDQDNRTVRGGLEVPGSIVIESDPRTGLLRENKATFTLLDDYSDTLAALFRTDWDAELDSITAHIKPSTTFPTDDIGTPQSTTTVWGRHVGLERIGDSDAMGGSVSNGDRRAYYITPSDVPPGLDHPWIDSSTIADLPNVYVSDSPYAFAGRRVALYRIVYDPDSGTWPSWSDQYDGGSLIWQGAMTDSGQMVDVGKFAIECAGPASITRKTLNGNRTTQPSLLIPRVDLDASERGVAVWFEDRGFGAWGTVAAFHASLFNTDISSGSATYQDLASDVQSIVAGAADGTSIGGGEAGGSGARYYEEQTGGASGGLATFTGDTARIEFNSSVDTSYGAFHLCLHARVWAYLGWDPVAQPQLALSSSRYVTFSQLNPGLTIDTHGLITSGVSGYDLGNYWIANFYTFNPENPTDDSDQDRTYRSLFEGGTTVIHPTAGQEIGLAMDSTRFVEGQWAHPPSYQNPQPTIDAGVVDSMGWFLFTGKIARGSSAFDEVEFEDYAQVARCSWRNESGSIGSGASGFPSLRIEQWEDPRIFGLPYPKISASWMAGGTTTIHATPMVVFASPYQGGWTVPDIAHRVITRILHSSGTSGGWGALGNWPIHSEGDNMPTVSNAAEYFGGDIEIADLGVSIPAAAIDFDSFAATADATIGADSPLNRCKYAYVGPVQAEDIISQAMSSRGWAFSWKKLPTDKRPRWGMYSLIGESDLGPGDVEVTLTESDKAGKLGDNRSWLSDQQVRYSAPVDNFSISTRENPITQEFTSGDKSRSLDREARGRVGRVSYDIEDGGLSDPLLWEPTDTEWQWFRQWRTRFAEQIGTWYAKRNSYVTATYSAPKGQFLYPGTVVSVTDPRLLSARGSYGITSGVGRVIRTELILRGAMAGATRAGIVLQQDQLNLPLAQASVKHWAPSARVYAHDSTNKVLHLAGPWDGDYLDRGGTHSDEAGFVEPSFSTSGGTVGIRIFQSEGTGDWGDVWTADIVSVDTTAKTITYTNESGTLYRDMDKLLLLQAYDDQAAGNWPRDLLMVLANELSSQFGSGPTDAPRLG